MPKKALQKAKDSLLYHPRTVTVIQKMPETGVKPEVQEQKKPSGDRETTPPALDWRSKILHAQKQRSEAPLPLPIASIPTEAMPPSGASRNEEEENFWLQHPSYDGQLAVDVIQTPEAMILQSAVAGVYPEDLEISMSNEVITIRGTRRRPLDVPSENYLYEECYWGGFSRSIILPFPVQNERAVATLERGILTILLPKASQAHGTTIPVTEIPESTSLN
jgi:HSP20 family protein